MTYDQLFRSVKAGDIRPAYLFYGPETYVLNSALEGLQTYDDPDEVRYNANYLLEGMIEGVKKCLEAGVRVGVGTDTVCPCITHYDLWRELEYMHRMLGITRAEALYLATLNNAEILGIDNKTGSIEKGKLAEFVLVEADPLEGFDTIRRPKLVVKGNTEIEEPQIKKSPEAEKLLDDFMATL